MKDITYNKSSIVRGVRYFNEYEDDDKETTLLYLGEELVEKIKRIDMFLSDEKGYEGTMFDSDNNDHIRIFAKLDMINEELMDIIEKVGLDCVEIH
jgi:hypothetical protein